MAGVKWNLGVVQFNSVVGDVARNVETIRHYATLGRDLGLDLIVFPECCVTGYFLGDRMGELVDPVSGPAFQTIGEIASDAGIMLAVGAYTKDGDLFRNSQIMFSSNGETLAVYHKMHLFAAEREACMPGDSPCVVETPIGRIGMTICYDMIFADYISALVSAGADLIINSTHWFNDDYQRETWGWKGEVTQAMAATRALENGTFVAMAARVGRESPAPGVDFDGLGYSCVAGPSGKILASLPLGEGMAVARIDISGDDMARWRSIATYQADRRPELYG